MSFTFTLTNAILTTLGTIQIQVPASIQLTGNQPTCEIGSTNSAGQLSGNPVCFISGRTIQISSFLSDTLVKGSIVTVTVTNGLINPLSTEPTNSFLIRTLSQAGYVIDQDSSLTHTATKAIISSFTVTPSSDKVADQSIYTFVYTLNKKIPGGSTIKIVMPSQISSSTTTTYSYQIDTGIFNNIVPNEQTDNGKTIL